MEIREYIAERRKKLGLSQSELAKALGYTDTSVCKIESGASSLPISILPALADKLQLTLDDLLAMKEDPIAPAHPNLPYDRRRVGQNLRAIRLANHLRQKDAAVKIGVSKRTLVTYEKGDACPNFTVFLRILPLFDGKPSDFFYGTLYPEIQSSPAFYKRGPSPFLLLLIGFLAGGALLASVLGPMACSSHSSSPSGPYQGISSVSGSTSETSSSSGTAIPYLDELTVIGPDGIAFDAAMKPNSTLRVSVYTGKNYTEQMRKNTVFTYSLETTSDQISIAMDDTLYPTAIVTAKDVKVGSWEATFLVKVSAYRKGDPDTIVEGTPLEVVVNDLGILTD
jgi:transcriptional regulator with XRE-family HTH domain